VIAGALLPQGLPFGVVLYGLILGGLSSLTAMGLVIVYRSARIINFAQAEIGGLAASVAVVMVIGWHLPYFLAVPVGMLFAFGTGALVDLTVVRTLFRAPRLILTVATIGLAQVLGAAELYLPHLFGHVRPLTTFTTPFKSHFRVGPMVFDGNDVVAMIVIPLVLIGLAAFFTRSGYGIAIRGAADSNDRAILLGIPVRRLSTVTWVLAAGLSGLGAILTSPILGPQLGVLGGPEILLAPLAAAVIARLESLTVAFAASLAIGVFQQAVFWSYSRSTTVDVGLFGVILAAMLLQRRRVTRTDDSGLGGYVAQYETRPIPTAMRNLPEVRYFKAAVAIAIGLIVVLLPLGLSQSKQTLMAYMAIFGILAASLVLLTGWSGQISLGQFAFAGVGAGTTASLFVNAHTDLMIALAMAAVSGALAALVIGIPALRLSGPFLAVTTLAFAVPVSDWLLNSGYFPGFAPSQLTRPFLFRRFDLNSAATFYYFCLILLVASVAVVRNYRRGRPGRAAIAVRDNARGAQSFGVDPLRSRLVAFALSGALAGVAGGLYAIGLRGIPFSGYNPETSVQIFTMVVVGGMGSLSGGLLGAVYVQGAQWFLSGSLQLLATGGGILMVVQLFPGGLGELVYRIRDFALRRIANARGMSVPSLQERAAFTDDPLAGPSVSSDDTVDTAVIPTDAMLILGGVDASYGSVRVLFGVDLAVSRTEIVGLLGTNGSGKSTALKVASGLLRPGRGKVIFEGEDISRMDPVDRVKRGLVMVPSGRSVFPSLTVRENLRLAGWLTRHEPSALAADTARVLALFPRLADRLDTLAGSLSGGEQQMLTISQALFCRPKLLMIDELSLGLAPAVVADLLKVVRQLAADGMTVVVVEQSLNLATSIAERAVFMERGQVRFTGPTADLSGRADLVRSVFLGAAVPGTVAHPVEPAASASTTAVSPAFSVIEVGRTFGAVRALEDVTFDAWPGEILGIIGANGAGKTTLFDICSGYLPGAGRIRLGGVDITNLAAHQRAELGLGRVFQDARLFPALTVAEVLAVALDRRIDVRDPILSILRTGAVSDSEQEVKEEAEALITMLGLDRYRDSFVSELSTGTRRIVELGCVMAHQPSVLLLDEPTSGLAQRESEALGDLLLDLRARTGATLVMIEHDVPLASRVSDRMICLDLGRVIAEGRPTDVLDHPLVIEAYLGADAVAVARSGGGATKATRRTTKKRATSAGPARAKKPVGAAAPPATTSSMKGRTDA
jgi:ABC-type branched-subunit amino acid transport system ATPase component/ABC-type branched-subunit amino acid transport system permease subunit